MDRGRNKQGILTLQSMGKSNRLRFSAGLDRKPEWTGAGLRRFYCTCVFENVGTELAHNALLLAPVSTSHMEISLFPCVAEIIQDCSCGWVVRRLTLLPVNI